MDKTTLRNTVRQALATMTDEDYHRQSLAVLNKVLQEPYIIEANTIGMTISNKPEVDTINWEKRMIMLRKINMVKRLCTAFVSNVRIR